MEPKEEIEVNQIQSTIEVGEEMWHKRLGHLNHGSLTTLAEKEMVIGLPKLNDGGALCDICMKGKQNRECIPKQSAWRSNKTLELVHSDICGPISPISSSGKRYILNFIDDQCRKCWTFFLNEKSEAFKMFKEFKAAVEREIGELLICLRTDRGGEFTSRAFQEFCVENGIKRQLTAAYTPQQNGVAERKNISLMNMARCMLFGMKVPLIFWPEAVQYAVHILNRSPTKVLGEVTPTEKWSKHKPLLNIYGSLAVQLLRWYHMKNA